MTWIRSEWWWWWRLYWYFKMWPRKMIKNGWMWPHFWLVVVWFLLLLHCIFNLHKHSYCNNIPRFYCSEAQVFCKWWWLDGFIHLWHSSQCQGLFQRGGLRLWKHTSLHSTNKITFNLIKRESICKTHRMWLNHSQRVK